MMLVRLKETSIWHSTLQILINSLHYRHDRPIWASFRWEAKLTPTPIHPPPEWSTSQVLGKLIGRCNCPIRAVWRSTCELWGSGHPCISPQRFSSPTRLHGSVSTNLLTLIFRTKTVKGTCVLDHHALLRVPADFIRIKEEVASNFSFSGYLECLRTCFRQQASVALR